MGLFAGISLEGLTLRPDSRANEAVYGRKIDAPDIVRSRADRAKGWITLLNKYRGPDAEVICIRPRCWILFPSVSE